MENFFLVNNFNKPHIVNTKSIIAVFIPKNEGPRIITNSQAQYLYTDSCLKELKEKLFSFFEVTDRWSNRWLLNRDSISSFGFYDEMHTTVNLEYYKDKIEVKMPFVEFQKLIITKDDSVESISQIEKKKSKKINIIKTIFD